MADTQRPPHRGGGRGGRGEHRGGRGGRGGHEGGGRGGHGGGGGGGERERPKKENILDLGKYMDKKITVKFTGGREGEFLSFVPFFSVHLPSSLLSACL
jgi:U6 snRNA-associated Sm-like protein LSm7